MGLSSCSSPVARVLPRDGAIFTGLVCLITSCYISPLCLLMENNNTLNILSFLLLFFRQLVIHGLSALTYLGLTTLIERRSLGGQHRRSQSAAGALIGLLHYGLHLACCMLGIPARQDVVLCLQPLE